MIKQYSWFFFSSEATDAPTKAADLAKGIGLYFNLQAENSTDFKSTLTDDMDCQSVSLLISFFSITYMH
jgi:hypothetical protein